MPAEHDDRGSTTQKPGEEQAKPAKVKRHPDFEKSGHGMVEDLPAAPAQPGQPAPPPAKSSR